MVKQKLIAIIPARGGSKRIPNKNIIDFFGLPLIAHTIKAAQNTKLFDQIIVSTDDPKIQDIAIQFKAKAPFLRDQFQDDNSPVSAATVFTLKRLEEEQSAHFDIVFQLLPSCPLRNADHIHQAYENFISTKADSLVSCCRYGWLNPWWARTLDGDQQPTLLFPETHNGRSQDLPSLFSPTGAIWAAKTDYLKKHGTFYGPNHRFWEMDWQSAIDIDEPEDLRMAKALFLIKGQ